MSPTGARVPRQKLRERETKIIEARDCAGVVRVLSQRFTDDSIDQWRRRLQCVVQENGGHIEHKFKQPERLCCSTVV